MLVLSIVYYYNILLHSVKTNHFLIVFRYTAFKLKRYKAK